jgi:hypothetical protein
VLRLFPTNRMITSYRKVGGIFIVLYRRDCVDIFPYDYHTVMVAIVFSWPTTTQVRTRKSLNIRCMLSPPRRGCHGAHRPGCCWLSDICNEKLRRGATEQTMLPRKVECYSLRSRVLGLPKPVAGMKMMFFAIGKIVIYIICIKGIK